MPWREITRPYYCNYGLRYTSDLNDDEWLLIKPMMPKPSQLGRSRTTRLGDVMKAILYIASTGFQWRLLPKGFPP